MMDSDGFNQNNNSSAVWEAEIDDDSEDTFSITNHNLISLNRNQNNLNRHGGPQDSYE